MADPINYLKLSWLILRHGRLSHSGEDFNKNRIEGLKELQDFIPKAVNAWKNGTSQRGIIRNIIAQAAFVKNSFKPQRGHLTVQGLNYIRIPKSASTSMSKEFLEKKYAALRHRTVTEKQLNFLTDLNLETEINAQPYFTIVRNPFARLVSVYRDFFENPAHYIYRDYLFGILTQEITFPTFVDRISRIPDRLKDQHLKPQHLFLKFYQQKNVDVKVFKLEEPESLNNFLHGYEMKLQHVNTSGSYDYTSYYDRHTLKKAFEIYQDDVKGFGYENEYKMLTESLK
jgi:hypothetical protein